MYYFESNFNTIKCLTPSGIIFKDMTREELQNEFGDAVCVYCNKNIIPEHNLCIGFLCEGNWCEEAQDGYAIENNIELED